MVENKKYSDLELFYNIYIIKQKTWSIYGLSKILKIPISTLHGKIMKLIKKGAIIKKRRGRKTVFLINPVFIEKKNMDAVIMGLLPVLKTLKDKGMNDVRFGIDFFLYASSEI